MCSGLLGATRTRIQPVIKPARHFAHFVTRYWYGVTTTSHRLLGACSTAGGLPQPVSTWPVEVSTIGGNESSALSSF